MTDSARTEEIRALSGAFRYARQSIESMIPDVPHKALACSILTRLQSMCDFEIKGLRRENATLNRETASEGARDVAEHIATEHLTEGADPYLYCPGMVLSIANKVEEFLARRTAEKEAELAELREWKRQQLEVASYRADELDSAVMKLDAPKYWGLRSADALIDIVQRARAAESELTALREEVERLKGALETMKRVAGDALEAWDADSDSRVGKLLGAMAGHKPGYRNDIDNALAALSPSPAQQEHVPKRD